MRMRPKPRPARFVPVLPRRRENATGTLTVHGARRTRSIWAIVMSAHDAFIAPGGLRIGPRMFGMTQPIYSTADIRRIEQRAGDVALMELAGAAAAQMAMRLMPEDNKDILVVAGPGNNGGDARIAARQLSESYYRVSVASRMEEIATDKNWGLVIDGLFGIGLAREVAGGHAPLLD